MKIQCDTNGVWIAEGQGVRRLVIAEGRTEEEAKHECRILLAVQKVLSRKGPRHGSAS